MKTKLLALLFLVLALSVTLVACNDEPEEVCNHKWDLGVVKTDPTCLTDGVRLKTCFVCEKTQEFVEPAVGQHVWGEGSVTTEPTCGADGVTTYACTACGTTTTEAIAATGMHMMMSKEETILTEPTCGVTGTRSRTCLTCGYVRVYVTPSTGEHVPDETNVVAAEDMHYTPCTLCGKALTKEAHTWDAGTIIVQPVGCKAGIKDVSCKVCGQTAQVSAPSIQPHKTSATIDKENSVVTYTCSVCGEAYTYALKYLYDFENSKVPLSLLDGDGNGLSKETELSTWVETYRNESYQVLVRTGPKPSNERAAQAQNNNGLVTSSAADAVISIDIMSVSSTNTNAKFSFSFYNSGGSWSDGSKGIEFFQIIGTNMSTTQQSLGTINSNGWTNVRMEIQIVGKTFVVKYYVNDVYKTTRTIPNTLLNGSYNVIYLNSNVYDTDTGFYFDNFFFGSK